MKLSHRLILVAAAASLLAACGPPDRRIDLATARQMIADDGLNDGGGAQAQSADEYLTPTYRSQAVTDKRNAVLHHLHIGLAALQSGERDLAAQSFDAALIEIETIYGGDEAARRARQNYNAEADKVFRGEPYERAMAYYYRGILYLLESDFENARASFKSAVLQDSLAGNQVHREDFALLAYLEGWASQCNGDDDLAEASFADAQKHQPKLRRPHADADVLVIAEQGAAPVKYTAGEYNELLKIKAGESDADGNFYISERGEARQLPNAESISYQATTRGGREFDAVLAGKVQFKERAQETAETAAVVGDVALVASQALLQSGQAEDALDSLGLGLAADAVSLFKSGQAEKTKPQADTRQWANLPDRVEYGAYRANRLGAESVQYGGASGDEIAMQRGGANACEVVWTRYVPGRTAAVAKTAGSTIPPFMKKLDGCWESEVALAYGFIPMGSSLGAAEYRTLSGDTYLHRVDGQEKVSVVKYQVTGGNSWKEVAWNGEAVDDPDYRRWFRGDDEFRTPNRGGAASAIFEPTALNGIDFNRESARKCGGFFLQ